MDLFWHRLIFKKELFPDTNPPETIVNQKLLKIKTEAKNGSLLKIITDYLKDHSLTKIKNLVYSKSNCASNVIISNVTFS